MTYKEKLQLPEWRALKKRICVERDNTCEDCGAYYVRLRDLQLHHKFYDSNKEPWEYPDDCFKLLCGDCHELTTEALKSFLYVLGRLNGNQIVDLGNSLLNAIVDTGDARIVNNWLLACLDDISRLELKVTEREPQDA
jgi:hypothetical protein